MVEVFIAASMDHGDGLDCDKRKNAKNAKNDKRKNDEKSFLKWILKFSRLWYYQSVSRRLGRSPFCGGEVGFRHEKPMVRQTLTLLLLFDITQGGSEYR